MVVPVLGGDTMRLSKVLEALRSRSLVVVELVDVRGSALREQMCGGAP